MTTPHDDCLEHRGTPYHPKEWGRQNGADASLSSGLFGCLEVLGITLFAILVFLVTFLPILFGLAEVVLDGPTCWRVRWIRRPAAPGVGE